MGNAEGRGGTSLFDDVRQVEAFTNHILDSTSMAWSVHVGGGNSYKVSIYVNSNSQQMIATAVDVLKAELMRRKFATHA